MNAYLAHMRAQQRLPAMTPEEETELRYMTGQVPLFLKAFERVFAERSAERVAAAAAAARVPAPAVTFQETWLGFRRVSEITRISRDLKTFAMKTFIDERALASMETVVLLSLSGELADEPIACYDRRYFWVDLTSSAHCLCGFALRAWAAIVQRKSLSQLTNPLANASMRGLLLER
jgi:hypothetical protein